MTQWIPCGGEFLEADVVRWKEAIWEQRGRQQSRAAKIGEREVVAEVLRDDDSGWVRLLVRASTITDDKTFGRRAHPLTVGVEVKRKRATLERGTPERLAWSDESARAALAAERPPRRLEPQPESRPRKPRAKTPRKGRGGSKRR